MAVSKAMFPGSDYHNSFWNCGKCGPCHAKCLQPITFKVIAPVKASFLENRRKKRNGTKRVLHKMVKGQQKLMEMATGTLIIPKLLRLFKILLKTAHLPKMN